MKLVLQTGTSTIIAIIPILACLQNKFRFWNNFFCLSFSRGIGNSVGSQSFENGNK